MQEWGCLGRRVCLVWVNLCAVKGMQEESCATCANTHSCASLPSLGAHHNLGWPMQSHVLPCYSLYKFPFHLNHLTYSTTTLFLKTRLLVGNQHCNFINIFLFGSLSFQSDQQQKLQLAMCSYEDLFLCHLLGIIHLAL